MKAKLAGAGLAGLLICASMPASAEQSSGKGPSFSCSNVVSGSVESMVCGDATLAALDRKLSGVFAAAMARTSDADRPRLKAEQRGWIKGRNECWKHGEIRPCVERSYKDRIAEFQALYDLVPVVGSAVWDCGGGENDRVSVRFFDTDPQSLVARRGAERSFMVIAPAASGSRYSGMNTTYWEHQGEAMISWGPRAPERTCHPLP